jgi:hypothetical protein
MLVQQVNPVSLHPLERLLDNKADAFRPAIKSDGGIAIDKSEFRGDDDLVAKCTRASPTSSSLNAP